jgi:hypothetical protein
VFSLLRYYGSLPREMTNKNVRPFWYYNCRMSADVIRPASRIVRSE